MRLSCAPQFPGSGVVSARTGVPTEGAMETTSTYLSFAYAGADAPGKNAFADGGHLAAACYEKLQKLEDPSQFPPRLIVLLASPKYLENDRAHDLVPGIATF